LRAARRASCRVPVAACRLLSLAAVLRVARPVASSVPPFPSGPPVGRSRLPLPVVRLCFSRFGEGGSWKKREERN